MPRRATALLLLPFVFASCSNVQQVTARLHSTGDKRLIGVAVFRAAGSGTWAIVNVANLEPDSELRGAVTSNTCAEPGANFWLLPRLQSDDEGRARASGRVRFEGREDVALPDLANGRTVVRLFTYDPSGIPSRDLPADVACGRLPRV